jgi:glycerophosphoryl diester phosphodiesterase
MRVSGQLAIHNAGVGFREGVKLPAALLLVLTAVAACGGRRAVAPPLPDVPRPIVFAHRGGSGEAPENTVRAMQAALAANPDVAIELDVRRSRDGHLVVIHDATVDRTTDGTGKVAELTLAELQALDAGHCATPGRGRGTASPAACRSESADRFPFRGQGYRIPTLAEVFAGLPTGTLIGIELKAPGYEAAVAELLRKSGRQGRLMVGSGQDEVAARLRALLPEVPQYFPRSAGVRFAAAAKFTNGALARPDYQVFAVPLKGAGLRLDTAGMIRAAHAAGVMITFWTINDPAEMDRLVRLGADGIITDYPGRAARLGSVVQAGDRSVRDSAAGTHAR